MAEAKKKRTDEVFGMSNEILPDSYVDRGALDSEVSKILSRRVHLAIKGPSKSGKSWLRQRTIPNALIVQCRFGYKNTDIFKSALSDLGIKLVVEESTKSSFKGRVEAQGSIGTNLIGKVSAKVDAELAHEDAARVQNIGRDINDLKFIANLIKESGKRLVIEDVHYLPVDQREILAFDLKSLWDYGCFVVLVGVWGDANMYVDLNGDLSGRIEEQSIEWSPDDLRKIFENGSNALKVYFSRSIQNKAIIDCHGNAGLLQRLILKSLDEAKIEEAQDVMVEISEQDTYESAAMSVADQLNGVYQKFAERVASGIRTRNDSTGIYAHAMAAIIDAEDAMHMCGIPVDDIFDIASKRQPRIQKSNLKAILKKIDGLQVDKDGRGLVVTYDSEEEKVLNVDRQLLFYRQYVTINWPWEQLIREAEDMATEYPTLSLSTETGSDNQ